VTGIEKTERRRVAKVNHAALAPHTPYIAMWSEEYQSLAGVLGWRGSGLGYLDETMCDRDRGGALWLRALSAQGRGEPWFGQVHPYRQRRAVRKLLCNVCGKPADENSDGTLWLIQDNGHDWPDWPEGMGVTEPPVCLPCVKLASRLCPALRGRAIAIRARESPIAGVCGDLYRIEKSSLRRAGREVAPYGSPLIPWIVADQQVRELRDCTVIDIDELGR
jgi:hypothetical protein